MIKVKLNTTQWKKIGTRFDRMASRVEKAGNRDAVRKAATPMLKAAKRLTTSVRVRRDLIVRSKTELGIVSVRIGGKRLSDGIKLLHLLEFGHRNIKATREPRQANGKPGRIISTRVIGFVPAKPFLRPAYYQTHEQSKAIYRREIMKDIQKHVRKERDKASF
jgi:HK97 gp10 family phage protein